MSQRLVRTGTMTLHDDGSETLTSEKWRDDSAGSAPESKVRAQVVQEIRDAIKSRDVTMQVTRDELMEILQDVESRPDPA